MTGSDILLNQCGSDMAESAINKMNKGRLPRHGKLLDSSRAVLAIVDIQSILIPHIWQKEILLQNVKYLIELAGIHQLPTIITEHNPEGLGNSDPELIEHLERYVPNFQLLEKNVFSCCGHADFISTLKSTNRDQVILCGMETHICINQTAHDLLVHEFEVHVVEDAVRARSENSHRIGVDKLKSSGAVLCDWEMAAYELTYGAKTGEFKQLLNLMKKAASEKRSEVTT
jgi:isochorismate hydrolase